MVQLIDLIITSAFTGIGTALGLAIFELFFKDKIHYIGTKIKDAKQIIPKRTNKEVLEVSSSIHL